MKLFSSLSLGVLTHVLNTLALPATSALGGTAGKYSAMRSRSYSSSSSSMKKSSYSKNFSSSASEKLDKSSRTASAQLAAAQVFAAAENKRKSDAFNGLAQLAHPYIQRTA